MEIVMSDKNYLAAQGVTDQEIIDEFGDPGDEDIDLYAARMVRERNKELYMEQGMKEKEANAKAHKGYAVTMNRIRTSKKNKK